ncbi:MAG TPA: septum formation initiator family protein [Deinococcales bacterium]|nr:septum formation initiator family protein [Deinococcales bacterium]
MEIRQLERSGRMMRGIIITLALIGVIQVCFMLLVELRRGWEARAAISQLQEDVAELEAERARLAAIIENGDSDGYRMQLARRQGFMMPDETRVLIIGVP